MLDNNYRKLKPHMLQKGYAHSDTQTDDYWAKLHLTSQRNIFGKEAVHYNRYIESRVRRGLFKVYHVSVSVLLLLLHNEDFLTSS